VRSATAALTAVGAAAVLLLSWHEGSRSSGGPLAGVHVIAAPPTRAPSSRPAPSTGRTRAPAARSASPWPAARRSVDGALVQTPYGEVQVRVVLSGQKLTDVQAVRLTDANGRSREISAGAAPILRDEALAAQSARVDTVSGATYTSEGYRQSLQAALDAAHA